MIRLLSKAGICIAAMFIAGLGLASQAQAAPVSLTIGLSNGWVGSEWRTQMIAEAEAAAAAWKARGVNVHVIVQSDTTDVPGQIGQVRNFINQGVNAIIIDPNSPTAFSPVFAQAHSRGILVIATDAEVSSKDAIYVGIDQKEWAEKSAAWLANALHGQGNVVAINGIAGNAANEMRVAGYREVFAKYPGIKVLNEANANWDEAQGQQVAQNLLATYPNIQGIWVQDGMAAGAWRAIIGANKASSIAATGEIRKDFLTLWASQHLDSGASVNPPGVMASALNVAVLKLTGKTFKNGVFGGVYGNAIYIPIPFVDNSNLHDALKQAAGKPGYWSVTNVVTPDEAMRFFD